MCPDVEELVRDEIGQYIDCYQDEEFNAPKAVVKGTAAGSSWEYHDQNKCVEEKECKTGSEASKNSEAVGCVVLRAPKPIKVLFCAP